MHIEDIKTNKIPQKMTIGHQHTSTNKLHILRRHNGSFFQERPSSSIMKLL